MNTSETQALSIVDVIEAVSDYWIGGGWGIDALVGHQTRPHIDLDICFPAPNLDAIVAALQRSGFTIEQDWRPARLLMTHPDKYGVDLNPLNFDATGVGTQVDEDGEVHRYPTEDLVVGSIGGRWVPCLSARLQLELRGGAEAPDSGDIALLRELLGG